MNANEQAMICLAVGAAIVLLGRRFLPEPAKTWVGGLSIAGFFAALGLAVFMDPEPYPAGWRFNYLAALTLCALVLALVLWVTYGMMVRRKAKHSPLVGWVAGGISGIAILVSLTIAATGGM